MRGLIGLLLPAALNAQEPSKPWSVEEIHGPARKVAFTVDEGTWISLDVSPDGRTIVFDLLGDLYTIPIAGGKATRLTSGTRWDAAPRYSPDGSTILFDSDPSGSDQLWTMPAGGGVPTYPVPPASRIRGWSLSMRTESRAKWVAPSNS